MEQTFKFTVELTHEVYAKLRAESNNREGSKGAVPSRTARQLIEERLQEMTAVKPAMQTEEKDKGYGTVRNSRKPIDTEDKPKQKATKPKSRKGENGADESAPA